MQVKEDGRSLARGLAGALAGLALALAAPSAQAALPQFEARTLNDWGNNLAHPEWGSAASNYVRLAPARYTDGTGAMIEGPNARYVSNRIFNSGGQDLFSERNVSQWVWVWGQFVDHTVGHAESGSEEAPISFDAEDPLESFSDTLGEIPFTRDAVAPGTGTSPSNPRQQVNGVSSFIDASALYGNSPSRLEWLRAGPDDGNPARQHARLLLPNRYLPTASARGDAATAPPMETEGALAADPQNAVEAGDVRANENIELTSVTTLFAREHNRIVAKLPATLTNEQRFQIARRVVGAEEQYITYNEFLPAAGVTLSPYKGYDPSVDPELSDEFATVGYRAHSMVNGELRAHARSHEFSPARIQALEAAGVIIAPGRRNQLEFTIPTNAAFFDPQVVPGVGLKPILEGLGEEPAYKNDEQIDDSLRSVLFGVPGAGADPATCDAEPATPGCFSGVIDLGAIDLQRGRDNGMPSYNQMREALGLAPQSTFDEVTGESSEELPAGESINDPSILEFTSLRNLNGETIAPGSGERAVSGTRRSTLASRLKAIYGSVDNLDAFVGMISEPHVAGSELGELQLALWRKQFEALRDGDRFFYENDPVLAEIEQDYGISYRNSLSRLLTLDAGAYPGTVAPDVFYAQAHPSKRAARGAAERAARAELQAARRASRAARRSARTRG
jgi:hypothetical protein